MLWSQKENLKSEFFGALVETDSWGWRNLPQDRLSDSDDAYRILILGASPSFGWGVPSTWTYARVIESQLQTTVHKPVKVINASVVGYSSWQGLQLLKLLLANQSPYFLVDKHDFIHPSAEGHKIIAESVLPQLNDVIKLTLKQ